MDSSAGRYKKIKSVTNDTLPRPLHVNAGRIIKGYAATIVFYHGVALAALSPWFFSWSGVLLLIAGLYVFGSLGINLYYHRLLTHRGLSCPLWLERSLAVIGVCCAQDTPSRWVAIHRRHHEHADTQPDPHSPLVSFFWGHVGWTLVENDDLRRLKLYERYARDVIRDPFQKWLERRYVAILLCHWLIFFATGFGGAYFFVPDAIAALQYAASVLIWGVFLRTVVVWHITWSVNSVSHLWGYRNYNTDEGSRNNAFVALLSNGEGWHNNHHADPRSCRHGHRWWELDVVYLTIRLMAIAGLAKDVRGPRVAVALSSSGRTSPS